MTDEQIKENAEYFATHIDGEKSPFSSREYEAYTAGAHSRDEEIRKLQENVAAMETYIEAEKDCMQDEIDRLQEELKPLRKALSMSKFADAHSDILAAYNSLVLSYDKRGSSLQDLQKELDSLRRPWVRTLYKLPEENPNEKGYSVEVIGLFPDGSVSKCSYSIEEGIWFIEGLTCDKPTHWMPMPEV